jgi:hypothetical protein
MHGRPIVNYGWQLNNAGHTRDFLETTGHWPFLSCENVHVDEQDALTAASMACPQELNSGSARVTSENAANPQSSGS